MIAQAVKPKNGIFGKLNAIASKSAAHRALICAALCSDGASELIISTTSADIEATVQCLNTMGASIEVHGNRYTVNPMLPQNDITVDCGESGSTLRFLLPVAAVLCDNTTFTGRGRLPERPVYQLIDALSERGAEFSGKSIPLTVSGRPESGDFRITGSVSSQFISGLLFALPILDGDSRIFITTKLESAAYVDMTLSMMSKFGVEAIKTDYGFYVKGNQRYKCIKNLEIEGDWSNAAFLLVGAALDGSVSLGNLDEKSLQSDMSILNILKEYGADVCLENGVCTVKKQCANPINVDVSQCPDLFPILAVLCLGASGRSRLYNAGRLRIKESDRLDAMLQVITDLGGEAYIHDDEMIVEGHGYITGGKTNSKNDHRIAMSAAVASLISKNKVIIEGMEAVNKSYPSFIEDFNMLGGEINVI